MEVQVTQQEEVLQEVLHQAGEMEEQIVLALQEQLTQEEEVEDLKIQQIHLTMQVEMGHQEWLYLDYQLLLIQQDILQVHQQLQQMVAIQY